MKIWMRHLFSQLIQTFLFFLISLFALYVIVDLSVHGIRFFSKSAPADIALYYFYTLSTLLDLFLSLSFLLAVMRVLFALNTGRELVALQMAGLSKQKLLLPFFLCAAILSPICYMNSQWISPHAQEWTDGFKLSHKPKKHRSTNIHVYSSPLEDGSELVYQRFDPDKKELFDVFWIRTPQDIWHMKTLQIEKLQGLYVNHFTRNGAKQFEKSESFAKREFPDLPWDENTLRHRFVAVENRPLSTLCAQALTDSTERASLFSHLYYKIFVPLLPFLILFAIGPLSLRFSRSQSLFLIAAFAIFGLIAFKIILDGMLILGENQVLPAILAIGGPIALVLGCALPSFARMR